MSKAWEFWITKHHRFESICSISETVQDARLWRGEVIHVIEHSAYQTAVDALKEISSGAKCSACSCNCHVEAEETLKELGEVE